MALLVKADDHYLLENELIVVTICTTGQTKPLELQGKEHFNNVYVSRLEGSLRGTNLWKDIDWRELFIFSQHTLPNLLDDTDQNQRANLIFQQDSAPFFTLFKWGKRRLAKSQQRGLDGGGPGSVS